MLFFNSWRASVIPDYIYDYIHPPAIQIETALTLKREAHIEPPLIECE